MIAEPYINLSTGEIQWHECIEPMIGNGLREPTPAPYGFSKDGKCIPYADFEREKLRELGSRSGITRGTAGYCLSKKCDMIFDTAYMSKDMGYSTEQYEQDSESNRLLKRAEFLKDICEKEGVEWLPKNEPAREAKEERNERVVFLQCRCGIKWEGPAELVWEMFYKHNCKPQNTDCSEDECKCLFKCTCGKRCQDKKQECRLARRKDMIKWGVEHTDSGQKYIEGKQEEPDIGKDIEEELKSQSKRYWLREIYTDMERMKTEEKEFRKDILTFLEEYMNINHKTKRKWNGIEELRKKYT